MITGHNIVEQQEIPRGPCANVANYCVIYYFYTMTSRAGEKVLSLRFNQDQSITTFVYYSFAIESSKTKMNQFLGCFTCCTDAGIRIHNVEPLTEKARYGITTVI